MSELLKLRIRPSVLAIVCVLIMTAGVISILMGRSQTTDAQRVVDRIRSGEAAASEPEEKREMLIRAWSRRGRAGRHMVNRGICWSVTGCAGLAAWAVWNRRQVRKTGH